MTRYTPEQIAEAKARIDKMSHYEMCELWRNTIITDGREPDAILFMRDGAGEYFSDRLFKHFSGFTPEISKSIGFEGRKNA